MDSFCECCGADAGWEHSWGTKDIAEPNARQESRIAVCGKCADTKTIAQLRADLAKRFAQRKSRGDR